MKKDKRVPHNKLDTSVGYCLLCGKPIVKRVGAKYNPKYCNMDCRNRAYQLAAKLIIPKSYICEKCGIVFTTNKGYKGRTPKFCSIECGADSKKITIHCLYCGDVIANKHGGKMTGRKYCSPECRQKARIGTKLSEDWCKALSDGRKKSDKCKGENLYNWKGGLPNTRLKKKERYYKLKGLKLKFDLNFLNRMFIAQDGKCFYCGCDLSGYKAIEHLTPITRGGDNHEYNLVYCCKSCNSNKRQNTLYEYAIKKNRIDWLSKWEKLYDRTKSDKSVSD